VSSVPAHQGLTRRLILHTENLKKYFVLRRLMFGGQPKVVRAVDGVSIDVRHGETLGLVGESGCGKTTFARTIAGLHVPTSGSVFVDDMPISVRAVLRRNRRSVQLVSQNPLSSLNRRKTILHALVQPLDVHRLATTRQEKVRIAAELLERVGLGDDYLQRYPLGMSVGELQRVTIARSLAVQPSLLILDEPTASIDVTMKGKLVNLLLELQKSLGLTYLVITHEFDIARHLSDRVAVMYLGKVVEIGPTEEVFSRPRHPYTQSLAASIPVADPERRARILPVVGEVPSSIDRPTGCAFHPRCPIAITECSAYVPELRVLARAHSAACHLAEPAVSFPPAEFRSSPGGPTAI
jgi:peptide/nickel transport system ATP-binding protein